MTGQELVKLTQNKLAGYANVASVQSLLGHLNEAKDEVWKVLKSLDDQHFVTHTQSTDDTALDYFPALSPDAREYDLPADFREMKFIEVVAPQNEESVEFVFRKINHPDFVHARRSSTLDQHADVGSSYFYTITGDKPQRFVLAQWPEKAYGLRIWYVRSLPDFNLTDDVTQIISPYDRKIADYAAKRVMLANDLTRFEAWRTEWREDVMTMAETAGPRNQADAVYVQDFEG